MVSAFGVQRYSFCRRLPYTFESVVYTSRFVRDGQSAIDAMGEWRKGMHDALLVSNLDEAATEMHDGAQQPDDIGLEVDVIELSSDDDPSLNESMAEPGVSSDEN